MTSVSHLNFKHFALNILNCVTILSRSISVEKNCQRGSPANLCQAFLHFVAFKVCNCDQFNSFSYCGHGNGREFLRGDDVQRITCKAVTLLMGCSSGKLQVNGEALSVDSLNTLV